MNPIQQLKQKITKYETALADVKRDYFVCTDYDERIVLGLLATELEQNIFNLECEISHLKDIQHD